MGQYGRVFRRGDYRWPSGIDRSAGTFSTPPEAITARTGLEFDLADDPAAAREELMTVLGIRPVELSWVPGSDSLQANER